MTTVLKLKYRSLSHEMCSQLSTYILDKLNVQKKNLRGLSPRANYTDRAAAAGRRS